MKLSPQSKWKDAHMDSNVYLQLASLTESPNIPLKDSFPEGLSRVLHSALGCGDESGELIKIIKDHLFYGKELTFTALKEEYGDLLWFIAQGLNAMNSSFEEVMAMNISKLRKRYPHKFEHSKAINRDVSAELAVLERFITDMHQEEQSADLGHAPIDNAEIWRGSPLTTCQICQQQISKRFVDGKVKGGSWGIMCPTCHATNGVGLGTGKGQEYVKVGTTFIKAPRPKRPILAQLLTARRAKVIGAANTVGSETPINQIMAGLISEADLPADAQIKCAISIYHAVMIAGAPGKIVT
ncbi:hypothetical protein LCGC14_1840420, partial [marine sediment metagenome]